MMDTTIFALRVFLATAETGSLEQAGKKMGRSPSAISMTLKQLSEEVGGDLFVSDRKNQLTELGRFFLDTARSQILYYDRSLSTVQAFARGEIGKLDLACVPSIASQLLPDVVREFIHQWPELEMDIRDMDSRSIMRTVSQGVAEIGLGGRPSSLGEIEFEPIFHDRLVVIAAKDYPVTKQIPVPWSSLKKMNIISNGIIENLDVPEIRMLNQKAKLMARNTVSLLALVRAKVGITILPQLSVPQNETGIIVLPLEEPQLKREVGLLKRQDVPLSTVAESFIKLFKENMNQYLDEQGEFVWKIS